MNPRLVMIVKDLKVSVERWTATVSRVGKGKGKG